MKLAIISIWRFYRDGFRQMTWGRVLWLIILLKLFVLFVVLRLFFFPDFFQRSILPLPFPIPPLHPSGIVVFLIEDHEESIVLDPVFLPLQEFLEFRLLLSHFKKVPSCFLKQRRLVVDYLVEIDFC